jgi:hypothetical protein
MEMFNPAHPGEIIRHHGPPSLDPELVLNWARDGLCRSAVSDLLKCEFMKLKYINDKYSSSVR